MQALPAQLPTLLRASTVLRTARSHVLGFAASSASAASAGASTAPAAYSKATSAVHWLMAIGIGAIVASVQGAMNTKDTALKGQLMK